jgi:predicted nucleic acid-binding protein
MKLFDTSILIEHLRGTTPATELFRAAAREREASASVLSRVEIEGTMRSHERAEVARLFALLRLEPVSNSIAVRAGEYLRQYRRSHTGVGTVDFVIAATADVMGAELVTLNVRHFPMFRGLKPAF